MIDMVAQLLGLGSACLAGIGGTLFKLHLEPKAKLVLLAPRESLFELPLDTNGAKSDIIPHFLTLSESPLPTSDKPMAIEDIPQQQVKLLQTSNPLAVKPSQKILVRSLLIQNVGKKTADNVEICYKTRPDHFQIKPSRNFEVDQTPDGAFLIKLKSLGHNEFIILEILATKTVPVLNYIRCPESPRCEEVRWFYQRVVPKWQSISVLSLAAIGLAFSLSCLILILLNGLNVYTIPHLVMHR